MSFKDQIAKDIDKVFLNLDDFAESHVVEGAKITCVISTDAQNKIINGRILGQIEADTFLYAKTEDAPRYRSPESIINVDGKEMVVVKWSESMGVVVIALRQNCMM